MSPDRTVSATLIAMVAAIAVAGCGSATKLMASRAGHVPAGASAGVSPDAARVITGWSEALRTGHVTAAARYFRLPSVFFSGSSPPIELRTLAQAKAVNSALPCGAKFISVQKHGRYLNALFRLTDRPGVGGTGGCGAGTGQTARTNFVIRAGRIVEWLRAPDEPGDNTSPSTPTTPGTTPGGGGPAV